MEPSTSLATSTEVEEAIRFALACVENQALLLDRLIARADANGGYKGTAAFERQAKVYRQHAKTIRLALDSCSTARAQTSAP